MKTLLLSLLLIPTLLLAQAVTTLSPEEQIALMKQMMNLFSKGGWGVVAGLGIGLNMLMNLFKLPFINRYLNTDFVKKNKWAIMMGMGILSGFLLGYGETKNLFESVSMGINAGIMAIGIRETTRRLPWLSKLLDFTKQLSGSKKK